ncbi:Phospholipid methyltransferase [Novymonas esmeraldas]|uniref:Phospholipid methyltransferase n=1 Tax=Novymonas esmeraldas TaxID=1808958 RepID=A0AAW0F502_9TRYP
MSAHTRTVGQDDTVREVKSTKPARESLFRRCVRVWMDIIDYVSTSLPGGPRCILFAHVINLQKCTTLFVCVAMMWKSGNFSSTAQTYTALHGSYGFCWYLKHLAFPDPRWDDKITVTSAIADFVAVLGPYWVIAFNAIVQRSERSNAALCAAVIVYAVGLVVMMGADGQKYFVLRERKGLITDGFFARTRNPNYLGEVMIYGSLAFVSGRTSSWVILLIIWTGLFLPSMLRKDIRMSRHAGWRAYAAKTGFFFPRVL